LNIDIMSTAKVYTLVKYLSKHVKTKPNYGQVA